FLGTEDAKVPYIIGVAGLGALGQATTPPGVPAPLAPWADVAQGGFRPTRRIFYSNAGLERKGPVGEKGFPENHHLPALLRVFVRHQSRTASGARAGILAFDL